MIRTIHAQGAMPIQPKAMTDDQLRTAEELVLDESQQALGRQELHTYSQLLSRLALLRHEIRGRALVLLRKR